MSQTMTTNELTEGLISIRDRLESRSDRDVLAEAANRLQAVQKLRRDFFPSPPKEE